jgi:hypothetical protein
MKARVLAAFLLAVALATQVAVAEKRINADEELQQAEEFRKAEQRRREAAAGKIRLDADEEMGAIQRPPRHIPDARYRVAVFTFEDPDKTGLGDALASLVGRRILIDSGVGSIGVLRYEGSLAPSAKQPLSYFDKVEALSDLQKVTLAVWGIVERREHSISVETFVQLPPRVVDESFSWAVQLPEAMGKGRLVARVRPSRLMVEHHDLSAADVDAVKAAALALDTLHAEPSDTSTVLGQLPVGSTYWMAQRKDDWLELVTDTQKGWVRSGGNCGDACTSLFAAAGFSGGLLRFIQSRSPLAPAQMLVVDARAVAVQLSLLEQLDTAEPDRFESAVLQPLQQWQAREAAVVASPTGAAFSNIAALAKITTRLYAQVDRSDAPLRKRLDAVKLDPGEVRKIAFDLAAASMEDPRNVDVLQNLAVLFRYSGDTERASLADKLAKQALEPQTDRPL